MDLNLTNTAGSVILALGVAYLAVIVMNTRSRMMCAPKRPMVTCLLDSVADIFMFLRLSGWAHPCDVSYGISSAMAAVKLNDLGGTEKGRALMVERYELVRRLGVERIGIRYCPTGHLLVQRGLRRRMENRLLMVEYLKRHPKVAEIEVEAPIFVVGFPRTGTTFLHEMLGLHEQVRSHLTYEQMNCVPETHDESREALRADVAKRYRSERRTFDFMMWMVGDAVQAIHRVGYEEPEECTLPMAMDFPWSLSELPLICYCVDELFPKGAGDAFALYRQYLQLNAWQCDNKYGQHFTWMLKCPFHLPYLDELHAEFPGATLVWTHRNPAECIASACSLYETLLLSAVEGASFDKNKLGQAVMRYTRISLDMAERSLEQLSGRLKVIHVRYADTVKSSKDTCRAVYAKAGLVFSKEYEDKLDAFLGKNKEKRQKQTEGKSKGILHAYSPEEYGLSKAMIESEFSEYIAKYKL